VAGLLAGRRHAGLGRLTTDALVAYFLCALGAHARVQDPAWRWVPAAGMLGLTLMVRRAYAPAEVVDLEAAGEPETIDLTTPAADRAERVEDEPSAPTSGALAD
jgi:hypothetical protein